MKNRQIILLILILIPSFSLSKITYKGLTRQEGDGIYATQAQVAFSTNNATDPACRESTGNIKTYLDAVAESTGTISGADAECRISTGNIKTQLDTLNNDVNVSTNGLSGMFANYLPLTGGILSNNLTLDESGASLGSSPYLIFKDDYMSPGQGVRMRTDSNFYNFNFEVVGSNVNQFTFNRPIYATGYFPNVQASTEVLKNIYVDPAKPDEIKISTNVDMCGYTLGVSSIENCSGQPIYVSTGISFIDKTGTVGICIDFSQSGLAGNSGYYAYGDSDSFWRANSQFQEANLQTANITSYSGNSLTIAPNGAGDLKINTDADSDVYMGGLAYKTTWYSDGRVDQDGRLKTNSIILNNGATSYGLITANGFKGDGSQLTGLPSSGGSGFTTYYMTLGGQMQDAYASAYPYDCDKLTSSCTITGLEAYSMFASNTGFSKFRLSYSTGSSASPTYVDIATIELTTYTTTTGINSVTAYDATTVSNQGFLALFIDTCPQSGNLLVGAGMKVRYWRKE